MAARRREQGTIHGAKLRPRDLAARNIELVAQEMTAHALIDWCASQGTTTSYIDPGAPWQNPFVESFHSRVRDELLNLELFSCLTEVPGRDRGLPPGLQHPAPALRPGPQGPRRLRRRMDA